MRRSRRPLARTATVAVLAALALPGAALARPAGDSSSGPLRGPAAQTSRSAPSGDAQLAAWARSLARASRRPTSKDLERRIRALRALEAPLARSLGAPRSDRRRQSRALRVERRTGRALGRVRTGRLSRRQAFFVWTAIQASLERASARAGLLRSLTGMARLPRGWTRAQYAIAVNVDEDGDGKRELRDRDDDGDRIRDARDRANDLLQVPNAYQARPFALDADGDARPDVRERRRLVSCVAGRRILPAFRTVRGAGVYWRRHDCDRYAGRTGRRVRAAATGCTQDADCDTLLDATETAGYSIRVQSTLGGDFQPVHVTSDPYSADGDGDGVPDLTEVTATYTNPLSGDTDGDRLQAATTGSGQSDYVEHGTWTSNPVAVDTDGDAVSGTSADPRLNDLNEVTGYGFGRQQVVTSLLNADTDGDGYKDGWEIDPNRPGYRPVIADLPLIGVDVPQGSSTAFSLAYTVEGEKSKETMNGSTTSSSSSTETKTTDVTNVQTIDTWGGEAGIKAKGEASKQKGPSGSIEADLKFNWQKGTITDHQTGTETTSSSKTSQEYKQYVTTSQSTTTTLDPFGTISGEVRVTNSGNVAVYLTAVTVTAYQRGANGPGTIVPIAELDWDISSTKFPNGMPLAGNGGTASALLSSDVTSSMNGVQPTVPSAAILNLMAQPTSLFYSLSNLQMNDANGRSISGQVAKPVTASTASVTIDDGTNAPTTYLVSAVAPTKAGGQGAGVSMDSVLKSIYGTTTAPYGTSLNAEGYQALSMLNGVTAKDPYNGFWGVFSSNDVNLNRDFGAITLQPGSVIRLLYLTDVDRDGLYASSEEVLGTDPANPDSDHDPQTFLPQPDGVSDFAETQTGWTVPFRKGTQPSYLTYSNPLLRDTDFDGSFDGCPSPATTCGQSQFRPESVRKTDPTVPDTNRDGIVDALESDANVLRWCPGCFLTPAFASAWGLPAVFQPQAVAVDSANKRVLVTRAQASTVSIFDFKGNPQGTIGSGISSSQGVAVTADGKSVYIANTGADAIHEYTGTGTFVRRIDGSSWDVPLAGPRGLAVDAIGNLWIADTGNNRIVEVDPSGVLVRAWGTQGDGTGELDSPTWIAIDPTAAQGSVYVTDLNPTQRVQKFSYTGQYLSSLGGPGTGAGQLGFATGVATDPTGAVYVTDGKAIAVKKYAPDGGYLLSWGNSGTGNGQFVLPSAVNSTSSCDVWVLDDSGSSGRLQRFDYGAATCPG